MAPAPSKNGRRRRQDDMKFAYSGPFAPLLDPIKTLPVTSEPYVPTSAESYTIGDAAPELQLAAVLLGLRKPKPRSRPRGRKRGGTRRVQQ